MSTKDPHTELAEMMGVDDSPPILHLTADEIREVELRRQVRQASAREHRRRLAEGDERATKHEAMVALLLEVLGALHDLSEHVPIGHRPDASFSRVWCDETRHALRAWRDARDDAERRGDAHAALTRALRAGYTELDQVSPNSEAYDLVEEALETALTSHVGRARPSQETARQLVTKIKARAAALPAEEHKRAKGLRMAASIVAREAL